MELTLLVAPNETLLTELYGWGEVPFDWINERAAEFEVADQQAGNESICMISHLKDMKDCSYTHIYMFPLIPTEQQLTLNKKYRDIMTRECRDQFKIHHIHDGVECYAFM